MTGPEFRNRIMSILQSHIDAKEALDAEGNGRGWVVCLKIVRTPWNPKALTTMQIVRGMYPEQAAIIAVDRLPDGIQEFSQKDGVWFVTNRNRREMFRRTCADIVRRTGPPVLRGRPGRSLRHGTDGRYRQQGGVTGNVLTQSVFGTASERTRYHPYRGSPDLPGRTNCIFLYMRDEVRPCPR